MDRKDGFGKGNWGTDQDEMTGQNEQMNDGTEGIIPHACDICVGNIGFKMLEKLVTIGEVVFMIIVIILLLDKCEAAFLCIIFFFFVSRFSEPGNNCSEYFPFQK